MDFLKKMFGQSGGRAGSSSTQNQEIESPATGSVEGDIPTNFEPPQIEAARSTGLGGQTGSSDRSFDERVGAAAPARAEVNRSPHSHIGTYRIVRLLGEGGMGAVYEAEQDHPRRTVALKVVKSAWAGPELLKRFEQESQTLARLHHSGIAQIYEAGAADCGTGTQPYFAMEYIADGLSLTRYADVHHLNAHRRLQMLAEVCDAVHYAHQRGIIHRDLKPGNILVDEHGHPKILDFGVARITDSDTETTRQTDVGQIVGTLAYMSPEQALADPLDLDTRSDVYALGVILYELLAGRLPYKLSNKLHEAVITIRGQDPTSLSSINRAYRGDIETLVAKALEKDKSRRYASAADLAADIRRYLSDEPIQARPASLGYQIYKFARRHRAFVLAVAAVLIVLAGGTIVSISEAIKAGRARDLAVQRQNEAEAARRMALQGQAEAERQKHAAEQAQSEAEQEKRAAEKARADEAVQRRLAQENAAETRREQSRAEQNFSMARDAVDKYLTQVSENPQLKAQGLEQLRQQLLLTAKDFYEQLATEKSDSPQLQHELGGALIRLGSINMDIGKSEQAALYFQRAIAVSSSLTQANPEEPNYSQDMFSAYNDLGLAYSNTSKFDQSEKTYREGISRLESWLAGHQDAPDKLALLADMYDNLGTLYTLRRQANPADAAHLKSLAIRDRLVHEHPENVNYQEALLKSNSNLVSQFAGTGRFEKAKPYALAAVAIGEKLLQDHPNDANYAYNLGTGYNNLAGVFELEGRLDETEKYYLKSLEIRQKVAREHPAILNYNLTLAGSYINLGELSQRMGRPERALDLLDKGVETLNGVLAGSPKEANARYYRSYAESWRAQVLTSLGRKSDAVAAFGLAIQFDDHGNQELRIGRARALAEAGDCQNAGLQIEEVIAKTKTPAGVPYHLAQAYAVCAGDDHSSAAQHTSAAAGALKLLHEAAALGYFRDPKAIAQMSKEAAFATLLKRPDFKRFLEELGSAKKE